MRKNYLFSLIVLVMLFAFAGMAFAEKMTDSEITKAQEEASMRLTKSVSGVFPASSSVLDEAVVIYETDFTTAEGWTIIDGGDGTETWALLDTAQQSDRPMFHQGNFMWVDSDEAPSSEHLIETLVSPVCDAGAYSHIYLTADVEYNYLGSDSARVLFTTDGGTNWTPIADYREDIVGYPMAWDITDLAVGQSSFQIAFHYDDGDGCEWYMGVDNVKIYGSDTTEDFWAPEITMIEGPVNHFVGAANIPVVAEVTDDTGVTAVNLMYGIIVEDAIPDLQTVPMTLTETANQYRAVIPGDLGVLGDEIGFAVSADDAAGHVTYNPAGGSSVYVYEIFPAEYNINFYETTYSFNDISTTGTIIADGDDETEYIDFTTVDGIDSFDWFGNTFTELSVCTNGWVAFGHETSSTAYITIPSTSTSQPNNILAGLNKDLKSTIDGSGKIYWQMVDGKLVVQYGTPEVGTFIYQKTFGPTFQIVIDPVANVAYVNYHTVELMDGEEPYSSAHKIGIENGDGTFGVLLYSGSDWTFPSNNSSYVISSPVGSVAGTVTATTGGAAIEEATITVLDGEEVVATSTSDVNGEYTVLNIPDGTYSVKATKIGYVSVTTADVVVEMNVETTVNFTLDEETATGTIGGFVYDADNATENTPLEGVVVRLVETDQTATSMADGAFVMLNVPIGDYTVEVNGDLAFDGYHNLNASITVEEGMNQVVYEINQILAPTDLQPEAGNSTVTLTFVAPANHAAPEAILSHINELQLIVDLHNQNEKLSENIEEVEAELATYRHIYENLTNGSQLDEIAGFAGYRVKVDDTILEDVFDSETIEITELSNEVEYTFSVAADYGYDAELLVFSTEVTATPDAGGDYWIDANTTYEWVEIRTNDLGTRVPWTEDDDYSGMIEFAGGAPFFFYGVPYTQFNIGSNGFVSFTEDAEFGASCPYIEDDIPNADAPNGMLAPHWDWTEIDAADEYSAYYYYDTTARQTIVTWYVPVWQAGSTSTNIMEYQLVLDLDSNDAFFNYKSAVTAWTSATIGIENVEGSAGVQYMGEIEDAKSIRVVSPDYSFGTISGHVVDAGDVNIADVEVWVGDMTSAITTTDADGNFGPVTLFTGTYDVRFVHEDYWTVEVEDVLVNEDADTAIPEVTMTQPVASTNPSSITIEMDIATETSATGTFELSNTGSGPMEYSASIQLVDQIRSGNNGNVEIPERSEVVSDIAKTFRSTERRGPIVSAELDEAWDVILADIDVETASGIPYNFGIGMGADKFYVGDFATGTMTAMDYQGNFVSTINIDASMNGSQYDGIFGIANDLNGYLYAGNNDGTLFKFLPDMSEVSEFGSITGMAISSAYDWDNGVMYVCTWGDPFYKVDASGTVTTLTGAAATINGLAYVPMDEDGFTIYGHTDGETASTIVRYNPSTDTWDETPVANIYSLPTDDDSAGDMAAGITNAGALQFMTLKQGANGDVADLWEGYTLQSWLTIAPAEGNILAGAAQTMTVTVTPGNDPEFDPQDGDEITSFVTITGPHMDDVAVVVSISFTNSNGAGEVVNDLPIEYALHQNYPNPFNPTTEIKFDLVESQSVKLTVYNMLGQEVTRLVNTKMQAGFHAVTFDATQLSSGVYFYRLETPAYTSMKKMVMVK